MEKALMPHSGRSLETKLKVASRPANGKKHRGSNLANFALDGHSEKADPRFQRAVLKKLRERGIDTNGLISVLWQDPNRSAFITEQDAAQVERQWRRIERSVRHRLRAFNAWVEAVRRHGKSVPGHIIAWEAKRLSSLDLPARILNLGDRPEHHRTAENRARRRQLAPGSETELRAIHKRIGPGAPSGAIRQRYMPRVRRLVYSRILEQVLRAVAKCESTRWLQPGDHPDSRRNRAFEKEIARELESELRVEARRLTAEFIEAFYPVWGQGLTPDAVRKAVGSLRR